MDACDTFIVTQDEFKSPNGRLKIAEKIFLNDFISEEEKISIYTCTLCGLCDLTCKQKINISEIIHASKIELVNRNLGPLHVHDQIIQGIIEKDNTVEGKPEERLDWVPIDFREQELFENTNSQTLLFLGCMSSFRVKESATKSYEILKRAKFDFKILKSEPCCGEYAYSAGKLDLAIEIFKKNVQLFKKIGIKNIIVTCAGCLYAFDTVYPKYIKNFNIRVRHVVEIIHELEKEGKLKLKPINKTITYHDPCRLGRKYKNGPLFNEPRTLLNKCGIRIKELTEEHIMCPCCGAGSGIRGVDKDLCLKIGRNLFDKIETKEIASSCPLCIFNFRYVTYKNQMDKESKYITDYILESLKK